MRFFVTFDTSSCELPPNGLRYLRWGERGLLRSGVLGSRKNSKPACHLPRELSGVCRARPGKNACKSRRLPSVQCIIPVIFGDALLGGCALVLLPGCNGQL